ncbi:MAG: hypothetical protein IV097_19530 [Burkholderiaceae bacterium]|nr:hypothetical protein [Burkholderiaceae bacterium]
MQDPQALSLPELEAALTMLARERYDAEPGSGEADARAAEAGDSEYLLAHIHCLQARLETGADDVGWIAPTARNTPTQSLQRIRAVCAMFPDLFSAMFVVAATHVPVTRERLALAIKQFRRDADTLSQDDMAGLLVSIVNGANQAFEAVLRTRRGGERKVSAALPWGKDTE